jgi:nucleoside 2-deoxyribosyltransferase
MGEALLPRIREQLLAGDAETAVALAREGESQLVELKEGLPQGSELAKELAAFSNSGGGVLIVGVTDNGDPSGWRAADAGVAVRRMREVANSAFPNLVHVRRGHAEGGWLAWAIVEPANEPTVTAEGAYWRRTSGHIHKDEIPLQDRLTEDQSGSREFLSESDPIRVFVAMSFREEAEPALVDYWQAMLRAASRARRNFDLKRVDMLEGDYDIVEQIYKEIDSAHMVIADLTLSPANVYLELGYARGRGKYVIQTCRDDTQLEFDVRGRRTLIYRNATTLEHMLVRALDGMRPI